MSKFDYPDKGLREPGKVLVDTVKAMRAANGDRKIAAKQLGITSEVLVKRLYVLRSRRAALEESLK